MEVLTARIILEKAEAVQLIRTTYGNSLKNLIKNPLLSDLVSVLQYIIIIDNETKLQQTQKRIVERKTYPAFKIIIEINFWTIHENSKLSIYFLLRDSIFTQKIRFFYGKNLI